MELTAAGRDLCSPRGLDFILDCPASQPCPLCRADVDRAVLNLLDNAARFTPAGGGPPRRGTGPLQHGDGGQGGAHPPPGRTLDKEAARVFSAASLYFPSFRAMIRGRV